MPGKPLIQITASLSYLSPPFLTAIAFVYLFSPNAGLLNVLVRDVMGLPFLTFDIFSMPGLVFVTVLHTFPFVYLLASSAATLRPVQPAITRLLMAERSSFRSLGTHCLPLFRPRHKFLTLHAKSSILKGGGEAKNVG